MKYFFYITVFLFVALSCSSNHDYDNEYDQFIAELDRVPIQDSLRIESDDSPVYTPYNITTDAQGRAIVAEGERWTLHLMNEQGEFLDDTGGRGRGPNEYSVINQIHVGPDNQLYVFDGLSQDITIYSFSDNQFQLKDEIALPKYDDGLRLKAIYKTYSGYIGVFKSGVGSVDSEQKFEVYRLGEDLQLQAHLFDMPGNETYMSDLSFQQENPLGRKTMWGMAGGQFYYASTNDLSVSSVNVESNITTINDLSDVPKPQKGEQEIRALETRFKMMIQSNPKIKELINEGEYLPYFLNFTPTRDYFYYTLLRFGKAEGILLRVHKETKEMKKVVVPTVFNLYAVSGNTLFGIDYTTSGAPEIMILELGS